jgi:hypothetical protein
MAHSRGENAEGSAATCVQQLQWTHPRGQHAPLLPAHAPSSQHSMPHTLASTSSTTSTVDGVKSTQNTNVKSRQ